jgi:uncharacterized membrane protein YdjX (TVP38/TMEM64 family)
MRSSTSKLGALALTATIVACTFAVLVHADDTQTAPSKLTGLKAWGIDTEAISSQIKTYMDSLEDILLAAGPYGPLYVFALYMVSTIFMLPLWGFHMTCGYVYGTLGSALLISSTQALAAGAAMSVSRYVVRPYVQGFMQRKYGKKFEAIDKAVSEDGLKITLLLRLSPLIPFGINNYMCGCTRMKVWQFVVGTFFGVLPGTTVYCHMGAMGKMVSEGGTTVVQKVLMGVGFAAALYVIHLINGIATKALKEAGIDSDDNNNETETAATKKKE